MDPGFAEMFVAVVFVLSTLVILILLRRAAGRHRPAFAVQMLWSLIGGFLVTLALVIVNIAVTGGSGLTGSSL